MTDVIFSPERIAEILGQHQPTDEQKLIIAADHRKPAVVIAGAGSGKTETMSTRLVYLIANGLVQPENVLGLTFTKKSAGDLANKVRKSLKNLGKSSEFAQALRDHGRPPLQLGAEPTISTYHSYAYRIVREHSLRLGIEPPDQMLGSAAAWQQVERIVREYEGEMDRIDRKPSTVATNLLKLVSQLQEHEVEPEALSEIAEEVERMLSGKVPDNNRQKNDPGDPIVAVQMARAQLIPLIKSVLEIRYKYGQLTHDDQMSMAAAVASANLDIGEAERAKFSVVLLDEYQDTSPSQLRLMQSLFGDGHSITAVGDPNQAIYAWRGASSDSMTSFPLDFPDSTGELARIFTLSMSWRNDRSILDLANRFSAPLREANTFLPKLEARAQAGAGEVIAALFNDIRGEAAGIGDFLAQYWSANSSEELGRKSSAILVRKKSQIPEIEMALRERGIPVEVVGIDGLIHVPEVAEIRAALTVLVDHEAGTSLIKLMSGGFWRVAIRDMATLASIAKRRDGEDKEHNRGNFINSVLEDTNIEEDDLAKSSIIETLDEIENLEIHDQKLFTPAGLARLTQLSRILRSLRKRIHLPIPDLIYFVERELMLGVDVEMTAHRRRYLDRFMDEAASFYAQGGSLRAFLTWMDIAEKEERGLRMSGVEVRSDVVQILTIHGAKGGEWDLIVIPGLTTEGSNPKNRAENWLTDIEVLPFPLRKDSRRFLTFDPTGDNTFNDVKESIKSFSDRCKEEKAAEDRRLMYVAATRAREILYVSTSWWRTASDFQEPNEYFKDTCLHIASSGGHLIGDLDVRPDPAEKNPMKENMRSAAWPEDPLGERRAAFNWVRSEIESLTSPNNKSLLAEKIELIEKRGGNPLFSAAQLVIKEVSEERQGDVVYLPRHLSVSGLMTFAKAPEEYAARVRRPLPFKPDPIARRGTAFHTWLEERFALAIPLIGDDEMPGAADEGALDDSALEKLKEKWLRSEWAARTPHLVEVPFERSIDGTIIRGRMDAVYQSEDGTFDVVDWKTGSAKSGDELANAAIQLAVYRLAWAEIAGVPLDQVRAAFHYVGSEETVRPSDLLDHAGLLTIIRKVPTQSLAVGDR